MSRPRVLVSFSSQDKVAPYVAALEAAGVEPVICEPGTRAAFDRIDGLLLTGGADVSPEFYGQQPVPEVDDIDPRRDAFELGLLALADGADLPTLAICRGLQILNVHRGGSLVQHLPDWQRHVRRDTPKPHPVHSVTIAAGSRLAAILDTVATDVNSRHHQAVDRLGDGLVVTSRDVEDGVVEAIEDPRRRFCVGVQWHPEDQAVEDDIQRRLFARFAGCLTR